jgi:hypothetical protein
MKRGPIVQGVLLIAALAFAYQTWTRDKTAKVQRGEFVLWDASLGEVQSIDYDVKDKKTVRIERRSDDHGEYKWALVTRTTKPPGKPAEKKPPKPEGLDAGVAADTPEPEGTPEPADTPEPEPEVKTVTKEFPVGKVGDDLFKGLSPLRALRELGTLNDEQREDYKLAKGDTQLTVTYAKGESRSLILGGKVYGGSDRYVLDPASGKAYIVPGESLQPLAGGDSALRDGKIFDFEATEVATVTIKTEAQQKNLVRGTKEGPHGQKQATWAYAETPDDEDLTLANFMNRVDKLTPSDYLPSKSTDGLSSVVRIEYADKAGKALGHIEVFKQPGVKEGLFDYFVLSKRTRVIAKTHPGAAKRVDKDLEQIFTPAE